MSTTIIWIRHGKKKWDNGKGPPDTYQHDPPILEDQESTIINRGKELIHKYGLPTRCICSPYLRTRQTAELLTKNCQIPIEISQDVSEYLGNQSLIDGSNEPHVHRETMDFYPPPIKETIDDFRKRCHLHLKSLGVYSRTNTNQIIWVITHGIVIKTIHNEIRYKIQNCEKIKKYHELDCFVYLNKQDIEIIYDSNNGKCQSLKCDYIVNPFYTPKYQYLKL